jgi:site-specific DNA-cytosine methylase
MDILLGCEESQAVCIEFRNKGHNAYSCDIENCSGGHPEWHIKDDLINHLNDRWDLIIAFPPCTNLCVSGARWFKYKLCEQTASIAFFMRIWDAYLNGNTKSICIENPIGIMSTRFRKPDQIIQPWQFGHGETKATCLWLGNLPLLKSTNIVNGRENRIHKLPPSNNRAKIRSKTYAGIAKAMAEQWG